MRASTATAAIGMACALVACHGDGPSPAATGAEPSTGAEGSTAMADATEGSEPTDSTSAGADPYDGEPLAIVRDGAWHWFDIDGMRCADGRQSGVGVRTVEGSTGLVLYFKGGGACFNASSCGLSESLMLTGPEAIEANPDGVLDFDQPDNPLAGYDVVYVPYCTGDIHGGTAPGVEVEGVAEPWDFVGHDNVLVALERLVPTFADASRLLVLGTSAGGIGALVNFPSIARGWPEAETFLLDDSGLIFRDEYLDPCLQQRMRDTWALHDVLPTDCPACETPEGGGMAQYYAYLADRYPEAHFGLVASNRDRVVRIFFGYGNDGCQPAAGIPDLGEQTLMDAVDDLRAEVLAGRFASYVLDSDAHVWTSTPEFYTAQTGDVPLRTWFDAFLAGEADDVAP